MYKSISFGTFWDANVMTIVRLPKMMAKKESQTIGAKTTSRSVQTGWDPIFWRKLLDVIQIYDFFEISAQKIHVLS